MGLNCGMGAGEGSGSAVATAARGGAPQHAHINMHTPQPQALRHALTPQKRKCKAARPGGRGLTRLQAASTDSLQLRQQSPPPLLTSGSAAWWQRRRGSRRGGRARSGRTRRPGSRRRRTSALSALAAVPAAVPLAPAAVGAARAIEWARGVLAAASGGGSGGSASGERAGRATARSRGMRLLHVLTDMWGQPRGAQTAPRACKFAGSAHGASEGVPECCKLLRPRCKMCGCPADARSCTQASHAGAVAAVEGAGGAGMPCPLHDRAAALVHNSSQRPEQLGLSVGLSASPETLHTVRRRQRRLQSTLHRPDCASAKPARG